MSEKVLFEEAFRKLGWNFEYMGHIVPANSGMRTNRWKISFGYQSNPIERLPFIAGDINYFLED